MDSSPFPSLAVPGVPDEPHHTAPHVPSGTELGLSWEVMTRQWLHRPLSDLGRKDAVARMCLPITRSGWDRAEVQGTNPGAAPSCWAAGDDLGPCHSLP